jgi:predicted glycoside hydrolase/deacetylase ChbG (UPF0249 family)
MKERMGLLGKLGGTFKLILFRMKKLILLGCFGLMLLFAQAQEDEITLIIRVDDMGFSHAGNAGMLQTLEDGAATSVEVMVPGPWFEEAAAMLRERPHLDAGIHLVLTSEWDYLKWRPLTYAPGLSTEEGYFHPFIWPNDKPVTFLLEDDWTLEAVEKELRAQIELAKAKIPQLSHWTGHMGCADLSPEVRALVGRLADEYDLAVDLDAAGFQKLRFSPEPYQDSASYVAGFQQTLRDLQPGKYLMVEHPALPGPEMNAIKHDGYANVGPHRAAVTAALCHPETKKIIAEKGIRLVSYGDVKQE